jgi:UDP-glucose 4-epimerase
LTSGGESGRSLVIGGCGFLGSYVVEALVRMGRSVRVLDRVHASTKNITPFLRKIELVYGDITSGQSVEEAIREVDHIFHFAGTTTPKTATEDPIFDLQSNVGGLLTLLEVARRRSIQKVIFCSTGGGVYGIPETLPITEDHPTKPLTAYGVSKLTAEIYLQLYNYLYDLPYLVLRLSNPYGPRQNLNSAQGAITHFLWAIRNRKPIEIWGDGSVVRDYFFAGDLMSLIPKVIEKPTKSKVLNIGSGQGHSLNEILREIEHVLGVKLQTRYTTGRKIDAPANILCINAAQKELGWSSRTSLAEGILKTWTWISELDGG